MVKREIIGKNPLDELIGSSQTSPPPPKQESSKNQKRRITVQISENIIERIKNATYWTPGLTLSYLVEQALEREVNQMEFDRGSSFKKRRTELKTGRPLN